MTVPLRRRTAFLPFALPSIADDDVDAVVAVLRSGWLTSGARVARLEAEFTGLVGAPGSVALTSCTAALHVALASFGIGRGDVVITTPWTYCATAHVIEYVGATPVFVDIDPDTLNIDGERAAEVAVALAEKRPQRLTAGERRSLAGASGPPRAIIPVHFAGYPVAMDAIRAAAGSIGAAVVEDAAHALGASAGEQPVGAVREDEARVVCFSFYVTKNITTGDGGMLVGPSAVVQRARRLSRMGIDRDAWHRQSERPWGYEVAEVGFKYAMTDIHAALGSTQLARLPAMQRRRAEIAARYSDELQGLPGLELPVARAGVEPAHHLYVVKLGSPDRPLDRERFIRGLDERNIGASVHFPPLHLQPAYRRRYGFEPGDYPVAEAAAGRVVSLPLYPAMSDGDVGDVIAAVRDILESGLAG
jgi:dTDP-4-amino-4,6-dideoxygalactose transaminase